MYPFPLTDDLYKQNIRQELTHIASFVNDCTKSTQFLSLLFIDFLQHYNLRSYCRTVFTSPLLAFFPICTLGISVGRSLVMKVLLFWFFPCNGWISLAVTGKRIAT